MWTTFLNLLSRALSSQRAFVRRRARPLDSVASRALHSGALRKILQFGAAPKGDLMRPFALTLLAAAAALFLSPSKLSARDAIAAQSAKTANVLFSPTELPADRDGASLMTIPAPGRYSIRVKSPSGTRLELIDMIAGPLASDGAVGLRDGRIDALLDKGVYKLRVASATGAKGKTTLSAAPFSEVDAIRPALVAAQTQSGELGDLRQRSYALDIGPSGRVNLEAIGRALSDLRLWREDGELVDLSAEKTAVETKPGRFMTRLRLDGAAAPGRYVVTAYGGEKLVWSDATQAQPFLLRLIEPAPLWAGIAEGVVGPFAAERFDAPASYDAFRLELPQPAPARLEARRADARQIATIAKNSREPVAIVRLSTDDKAPARLEVTGYEGQHFSLRAVRRQDRYSFEASGPHLIAMDIAGEGGDEIPATALFARIEKDKTRVLASDAPRVGLGRAFRAKFNLRGTTSLLFEATNDGPIVVDAKGVNLRATIAPALGALAPRADGRDPSHYDLQAGFYFLTLEPQRGATGVVDVTLGPPGASAPLGAPAPSRPTISFGAQQLEKDGSYLILANVGPNLLTGPRVTPLPAELDKAPIALWQEAQKEIIVPTRAPKAGKIVARDGKGADVALTFADEKIENEQRLVSVKIAPADKARAIGLAFVPDAASDAATKDAPAAPSRSTPTAAVGRPAFFDLARDETKSLRFDLAQGGLYRVETLGRLRTALRVGANVAPRLGEGESNGPGHNGLVTTYLRAGAYRAAVTAKDSAGHLGLSVTPATLTETPKLTDAGMARATLDSGRGVVIPFEIMRAGDYRLDLLGLTREWRARLEDADGWPLTAPGAFARVTRHFDNGAYRLVVSPEDVDARLLARLEPVIVTPPLDGHGPHVLPFDTPQKLQWREPQAKGAPRAPDVWRFSLHGEAEIDLSIGEGMIGDIVKGGNENVGKIAGGRAFNGKLGAGDYRVEARSLAHDDRLDYEISLSSTQLQPGAPRRIDPPEKLAFALARDSLVDLTSFGDIEIIGALKDARGDVIERLQARVDDWNVALARRLPAGAYTLEIEELGAQQRRAAQESSDEEETTESDAETAATNDEQRESGVEIRLALPKESDDGELALQGERKIAGAGAHVLSLPAAPQDGLALVAAQSESDVALSIERRDADGKWRVVGVERGRAPVAAWPAEDKSAWRVVAWSIGDAAAPITLSARAIERRARATGDITLEPVDDATPPLCVGKVATPDAALVDITASGEAFAGSAPGHALRATRSGPLAPQGSSLWLLARGDCKERVRVSAFQWKGDDVTLDIGEGEHAVLPPLDAARGKARLWLARSAFAQPGLDGGRGMGVANGAALALAGGKPLQIWNATGAAPMRVTLRAVDVDILDEARGGALYNGVIRPMSAQPVAMDAADAPLALDLAPGVAAIATPDAPRAFTVFGDGAAITRVLHGAGPTIWLVNLTDNPAPARIAISAGKRETLVFGAVLKRFFGSGGEIEVPVEAQNGDRLVVSGADATFVSTSGRVMRGASITLDRRGDAILSYKPGLVAVWLERADKGPWPTPAPRALTIPQRVALEGAAMRFTLKQPQPVMLNVTSGAPAIVAFTQNGARETIAFAAGVDLHRYMGAGDAMFDIYAPHDGTLSGALDVTAQPVIAAHEGVNDAITLPPGATALFSFETTREAEIGVGLRAEPDRIQARLFDATGKTLGEGVAQTMKLTPGRYFVEARAPSDAGASVVRLAILGVSPPPASPPDEIIAEFLDKAGLKKSRAR